MWLVNQLLSRVVRKGRLVITDYDGKVYEYGPAPDGPETIRVRLKDKGASYHIARDPQVGAGEVYMDQRMEIEPPHDIRDLVLFVTSLL